MMHWWSDKKSVARWCKRFDRVQGISRVEHDIGLKLAKTEQLSKADLKKMVKWKFDFFSGRMEAELKRVQNTPEKNIVDAFDRAIEAPNELSRVNELDALPGIGPAMASVILSFYDPLNYGVIDIHAWRELFGKEPKGFPSQTDLVQFLNELRRLARIHRMPARDIEKALFERDYEKSKNHE